MLGSASCPNAWVKMWTNFCCIVAWQPQCGTCNVHWFGVQWTMLGKVNMYYKARPSEEGKDVGHEKMLI